MVDRADKELIEEGRKLAAAVDGKGLTVEAAVWFYDEDRMRWRLFLAIKELGRIGLTAAFRTILESIESLKEKGEMHVTLDDINLVKPNDERVTSLRRLLSISKPGSPNSQVRISGNVVNGNLIPDGLVLWTTSEGSAGKPPESRRRLAG